MKGMIKMKKYLTALMVLGAMLCYALIITEPSAFNLSRGLLRFHIIAESDSEEDQRIKYDVRDYISKKLSGCEFVSLADYAAKAESFANERLDSLGAPYNTKASIERVYIPKKTYKNITLPAGRYNALRLELGRAEGENWWCVAYPPLCFAEEISAELSPEGEEKLRENLTEDEFELVTSKPKVKFFVVDLMGKIREHLM